MIYRKFGTTEETTSVLGFGCMRLPVLDGETKNIDEVEATKMIRTAIDQGVNYIDTAWPYHGEMSELFVGKALQDGYREKVHLATKLPSWLVNSYEDMEKYLDAQLEKLQTDYIDFYLVHALTKTSWKNVKEKGVFKFLNQALDKGKIKYAGFSFHDELNLFKEIIDSYNWNFCQIQYNYLDENYQAGREGLKYANTKGLGIVAMEPLRGGNLVKNLPELVLNTFTKSETEKTPVEWALKWLWNQPEVHVVLSGMSTLEQVTENIKYAKETTANTMLEKDVKILNEVKTIFKERIQVDCTGCEYCLPCPVGVNIPKNFTNYNNYFLFDGADAKLGAKNMYGFTMLTEEKASNCTQCGECLSHCPQNILIPDRLVEVVELLE